MISTNLIGSGKAFRNLVEEIRIVAPINCTVLIQGETGNGKEVVARAIHDEGSRCGKPFVTLNCAAIPTALLESEFFGHEKGAFTGAVSQTIGRFQAAHGGTLFLDEIGDLPLELQPKLLRVLQEQQFERLGSTRTTHVDVRVIAATSLHLKEMVDEKTFRADLFYRLNVFPILLTPLRDRKEDIPLLVWHFVRKFSERLGKRINNVPDTVLERLIDHDWPGNIRELQNFVERAIITSPADTLLPRVGELESLSHSCHIRHPQALYDAERAHITRALVEANWVLGGRNGAAYRLGLPRTTLISRMQRLGLSRTPQGVADIGLARRNAISDSQMDQASVAG
jgi:transcriptional regulator with GAF, ATPase, and Fis domain